MMCTRMKLQKHVIKSVQQISCGAILVMMRMIWLIVILLVILHGLMIHKTKNIGIVHQKILSLQKESILMYTVHMSK